MVTTSRDVLFARVMMFLLNSDSNITDSSKLKQFDTTER